MGSSRPLTGRKKKIYRTLTDKLFKEKKQRAKSSWVEQCLCVCGQAHLFRELIQTHDIVRSQRVAFRNDRQAKACIDFIGSKLSQRANINQCENPMRYFLKQ